MTQQEQAEEPSASDAFAVSNDGAPFLRPATARDQAQIEALIFPILESYGLSEDMTDDDLHAIEENYKGGMFDVLVDSDGKIVGTVALYRTTSELCELRKMYLSPTHRGSGLGRLLMTHALDRAKELGFKQMWLESSKELTEARNMYESYGFELWDSPPKKSDFCDYAMIKDLDSIIIRSATNNDREQIENLVASISQEFGLSPDASDLTDMEASYHRNRGSFDVLVDNETIVGTVGVHQTTNELCELRKLYVSKAYQGQGHGRLLLQHALDRAKALGYQKIWLETASILKDADRLYYQNGFEPFCAPCSSGRCEYALARDL